MGLENPGRQRAGVKTNTMHISIEEHLSKTDRELLYTILVNQFLINQKLDKIMGQFEDFSAALDKLDTDISAVAKELGDIASQTPTGALTADQAASLLARITGEQQKLEALAIPAAPTTEGTV
jgi:outer membrane murein-binding lipoprotein Lpp